MILSPLLCNKSFGCSILRKLMQQGNWLIYEMIFCIYYPTISLFPPFFAENNYWNSKSVIMLLLKNGPIIKLIALNEIKWLSRKFLSLSQYLEHVVKIWYLYLSSGTVLMSQRTSELREEAFLLMHTIAYRKETFPYV